MCQYQAKKKLVTMPVCTISLKNRILEFPAIRSPQVFWNHLSSNHTTATAGSAAQGNQALPCSAKTVAAFGSFPTQLPSGMLHGAKKSSPCWMAAMRDFNSATPGMLRQHYAFHLGPIPIQTVGHHGQQMTAGSCLGCRHLRTRRDPHSPHVHCTHIPLEVDTTQLL